MSLSSQEQILRTLAERRGLWIGSAVSSAMLEEPVTGALLPQQFNAITHENLLKFGNVCPEPGVYDFSPADRIVRFAEQHGMKVHGHTFVWHRQLPSWLSEAVWQRDELLQVMRDHIQTVGGRYRGRIPLWDVVNEAIDDDGGMRQTVWRQGIGDDYVAQAFRFAHTADPDALLLYNDYGIETPGRKRDAVQALLEGLLGDGAPLHGIGLQAHLAMESMPARDELCDTIRRFQRLGIRVYITELDIRITLPVSAEKLEQQGEAYREFVSVCLSEGVTDITCWGCTDKHSWVPGFFKTHDSALLFDRAGRPKPAFDGFCAALNMSPERIFG